MNWIAFILILTAGTGICLQDLKTHSISWWRIPSLTTGIMIIGSLHLPLQQYLYYILINLLILAIIVLCLFLYQWIKSGKISNIINKSLGLGDLFLFIAFCLAFSPVNFVGFLLIGFILSLSIHLVLNALINLKDTRVPLAAYLSVSFLLVSLAQFPLDMINLYDDMHFLHLII